MTQRTHLTSSQQALTVAVPDLHAYTPANGIGRVFTSLRAAWGERVQVIPATFVASRVPVLRNFPTGIRTAGPADVVLMPKLTGARGLRDTAGIPGIAVVHDIGVVDFPGDRQGTSWLTRRSVLQSLYSLGHARSVIVDSDFTRRRLAHWLPSVAERIVVVYPGVSAQFYADACSLEAARHTLATKFGRALGTPTLLYVGSELPRKNIGLLLRVFGQIRQRHPGAQLLKVGRAGGAQWRSQTARRARELGLAFGRDIVVIEDIDDAMLAACYQAADVFVSTSLYEGFGLPALEAMASGTPVVVANRGALPEVVGDAGWVSEPTTGAFTAAVEAALNAERPAIGQSGRERAKAFSWERAASEYLDVLTSLARPNE